MDIEELLKNLETEKERYTGKQVGVGQLRVDNLINDCIMAIKQLQTELKYPRETYATEKPGTWGADSKEVEDE